MAVYAYKGVDARGKSLEGTRPDSLEVEMLKQPVPGHEIRLTLDMELMEAFDRAFRPYPSGAAVVQRQICLVWKPWSKRPVAQVTALTRGPGGRAPSRPTLECTSAAATTRSAQRSSFRRGPC